MKGVISMTDYERIMKILQEVYDAEFISAKTTDQLMKKTLNPIRRINMRADRKRFIDHCVGISLAMSQIKRKMEI